VYETVAQQCLYFRPEPHQHRSFRVGRQGLSFHHDRGMTQLSGKVDELLRDAGAIAEARGHAIVGTEHVLLAMTRQTEDSFARRLLDEVGATDDLRSRIESVIGPG
jgi:ATP-dependent Clp protease ATP-binding subunit ClpA